MANLTTLYADTSAGAATTTSSTFTAFLTIAAASLEASTEYIIIAYARSKVNVQDVTSRVLVQLAAGGSEITGGVAPNNPSSARENQSTDACPEAVFLYKYTTPGTPVDVTLEHANADNADTVTTHGALLMIKLSDIGVENTDWFYAEKATTDASTGAFKNRETISFTPAAQADYLCLALSKWNATNTGFSILGQIILDDLTVETSFIIEPESTSENQTLMLGTVNTLDASAHNFKQRVASESAAAGNDTDWSSMFVMRLDSADDASWADSETEVDPSANDWNNIESVSHTPAQISDQILLAAFVKDDNGTQASGSRITSGGTSATVGDNDPQEGASWDATDEIPIFLLAVVEDMPASATTINLDYHPNELTTLARTEDHTLVAIGPLALNGAAGPGAGGDSAIPSLGVVGTRIPSVGNGEE